VGAVAARHPVTVLHYDAHFDLIAITDREKA
jgi:arginase family enzyme